MRNYKGNMLLIELIIVLLFFSLSQLVVVRLFAAAHEKAESSRLLSGALLYCEDVAERLSGQSNPDAVLLDMGFVGGDGRYVFSSEDGFDALVTLSRDDQAAGDLIRSEIKAEAKSQTLFTFPMTCYLPKEAIP